MTEDPGGNGWELFLPGARLVGEVHENADHAVGIFLGEVDAFDQTTLEHDAGAASAVGNGKEDHALVEEIEEQEQRQRDNADDGEDEGNGNASQNEVNERLHVARAKIADAGQRDGLLDPSGKRTFRELDPVFIDLENGRGVDLDQVQQPGEETGLATDDSDIQGTVFIDGGFLDDEGSRGGHHSKTMHFFLLSGRGSAKGTWQGVVCWLFFEKERQTFWFAINISQQVTFVKEEFQKNA